MRRPLILITTDRRDAQVGSTSPRVRPRRAECFINEAIVQRIREAGGCPLLIPPGAVDPTAVLALADGLIITGGHFDICPSLYGQERTGRLDRIEPSRTQMELSFAQIALKQKLPVLGVCGGMQVLAVASGGSLIQNLSPLPIDHEQPDDPARPSHHVEIRGAGLRWFNPMIEVNSTHHQAVDDPGQFEVCGRSPDGVIELICASEHFAVGVQWHPELLPSSHIYSDLVRAASLETA